MLKHEWSVGFENYKTAAKVRFEYIYAIDASEASVASIKLLCNPDDWFCSMIEKTS